MTPPSAPSAPSARPVRPSRSSHARSLAHPVQLAPQPEGVTIERKHRCRVRFFSIGSVIGKPCRLRQMGAPHRHRPVKTQTIRPVRDRPLPPTAGHTAAVAPLLALRSVRIGRSGIFECSPRNVSHLKKAEFLTLIHVCRARKRQLKQKGRPRAALAEFTSRHKTTRRVRASRAQSDGSASP